MVKQFCVFWLGLVLAVDVAAAVVDAHCRGVCVEKILEAIVAGCFATLLLYRGNHLSTDSPCPADKQTCERLNELFAGEQKRAFLGGIGVMTTTISIKPVLLFCDPVVLLAFGAAFLLTLAIAVASPKSETK